MKLLKVQITNFRKLEDINFELSEKLTTIVGQNGTGKTSIFEAIRLVKSILTPDYQSEAQEALNDLGVFVPQTNSIISDSIQRDKTKQTRICLKIKIDDTEINEIDNNINQISTTRLLDSSGLNRLNQLEIVQFLSTEQGKTLLHKQIEITKKEIETLKKSRECNVNLIIEANGAGITGEYIFDQQIISFLFRISQQKNYMLSKFSVFPADRFMPKGDIQVQIGIHDVVQQRQSFSSVPSNKFNRLKTFLVNYVLVSPDNMKRIENDFREVFENLIPGKNLHGVFLNQTTGKLTVNIKEEQTGAIYDIDFLSSGEKGLLLTCFLITYNVAKSGIILFDEPELHLNPSVNKKIVEFFLEKIVNKNDVQIVLSTHSPEIMTSTRTHSECLLLHLRNPKDITPVPYYDDNQLEEALQRLGVETAEILNSKGLIYVEGNSDVSILEEIFREELFGFKFKPLYGRNNIEGEIKRLLEAATKSDLKGDHFFIFDNDRKPSSLSGTEHVHILQWDRYCIENYLLNLDALHYVLTKLDLCKNKPESSGSFKAKVKELAFTQILPIACHNAFVTLKPADPIWDSREIKNKDLNQIAKIVTDKIDTSKKAYENLLCDQWEDNYKKSVEKQIAEMQTLWDSNWLKLANGKQLFIDMQREFQIKCSIEDFQNNVIKEMIIGKKDEFDQMRKILLPIFQEKC